MLHFYRQNKRALQFISKNNFWYHYFNKGSRLNKEPRGCLDLWRQTPHKGGGGEGRGQGWCRPVWGMVFTAEDAWILLLLHVYKQDRYTRSSKRPLEILRTPSPFVFSLTELKLNFRYLKVGIGLAQNTTSFYPRAPLTARVDASDLLQAKLP